MRPPIEAGPFGYSQVNVEAQRRDPDSQLSWLERAIRARRECSEFGWGACELIDLGAPAVLVHRCQQGERSVLVVHNFSDAEQHVAIDLREGRGATDLLAPDGELVARGRVQVRLDPFGYRWFRESVVDDGS